MDSVLVDWEVVDRAVLDMEDMEVVISWEECKIKK